MFTIWFSCNFNILSFSGGSSGPVFFSLGIKDTLLVLLVVNAMCVSQEVSNRPYVHFIPLLEHASSRHICAFSNFTGYSKNAFFLTYLFVPYLAIFSAVFGPKLGMRAMVQCRFSWGYVQNIFLILIYYCWKSHNSNSKLIYKLPSLFPLPDIWFKIADTHTYIQI